ncbi:DnaB-like helicase C-terminal domain-containing protein [Nocardiopsis sp. L17-MgMaSL7]|uniref:DnaB-like helicase C-terminal domain-containing protein n=1 Tax=Nocardiopsis sp. L17-MgMaSL7 TaxID=1938893 RepID=UPI000D85CC2D|nr:DnaB-like helicase C-terminal domain-containing protein [Nocardiopsis sp. L17-MgMaSL7]PWV44616.1 DnaB helicase-like protein [Nocardiopsis sp. L17-MgMaSL7]
MNPPAFTGVEPSQPSVQRLVPTLKAGSLAVLASRTTIGKTAWAVDLARHALTQRLPVLYCSGREQSHDLGIRFLAGAVGIDNTDLITGQLSPEASQRLDRARGKFDGLHLDVLDHPHDMFGELQEHLASGPRGLVVIDDIDALIDPTELHKGGAEPIAQQLTCLARDWQVSVLALTQLDRVPDAEYGRPPQWTDLGVRRPLADHAETVILLHRADFYDPKDCPGQLQVHVVKSATGETGEVALAAHLPTSVFTDLAELPAAPEDE